MKSQNRIKTFAPLVVIVFFVVFSCGAYAQTPNITLEKHVKTTTIKNQDQTGTCWSFATISYVETEAIKNGLPALDLSEMYFARYSYFRKAINYLKLGGKAQFTEGGLSHDVMTTMRLHGAMPDVVYTGRPNGETGYNHEELVATAKIFLDGLVAAGRTEFSARQLQVFSSILDTYLGKVPEFFNYKDSTYNPQNFMRKVLNFNPEDYVEITSYSSNPFYTQFSIPVSDNWANSLYYNLPLEDMMQVLDSAIIKGYSVTWDGDVSEKEFRHHQGIAALFDTTAKAKKPEIEITQAMRQSTFDNKTTTDDHLMHIVGTAKDDKGVKYYYTKNSWGETNKYDGYIYLSESYVKLKTIAIMVHKKAIPKIIAKKMGIN